ncbi:MAG: succinate-semialdehyde dehydrogenase / glutarate-semialdehyde dehydrogenase, partial [Streptosporangiaceae bacterium]|nr:succinate-semialdehyde dehydrogenase / glutarate-semialdehyde dehydrogenase [Streptosporangiaceae bacterium]
MALSTGNQTVPERSLAPALVERLASRVTSGGGSTTIPTPFTGEPLATLPLSSADDVGKAYDSARAAQRRWAALPVQQRVKPFLAMIDALVDRREEILDVIQLETGKARRHAYEEFLDVALCSLYYARRAGRLLRPKRRQGAFPVATRAREYRQPKGVVGLISPWNY